MLAASVLAWLAWRSRVATSLHQGARWLTVFGVVAALYSALFAAEIMASDLGWMSVFFRLRQVASTVLLPFGLLFVVSAMGQASRLSRWWWVALGFHPVVFGGLMLTNPGHHLLWQDATLQTVYGMSIIKMETTALFRFHMAYVGLVLISSVVFAMATLARLSPGQRPQMHSIVVGTLVPGITLGLSLLSPIGIEPFWLGPPSLVLMSLLWLRGMHNYRLFGFVPVAHETLVASLPEAVLVTDEAGLLMDFNRNAGRMLCLDSKMLGQPAYMALARYPALLNVLGHSTNVRLELQTADASIYVNVRTVPLLNAQQELLGWLTTLWDVTASVRAVATRDALIAIAQAAATADSLSRLFVALHANVQRLMPARNFYIALYDEASATIHFPYVVDEFEQAELNPRPLQRGLTEYVLRTRRPLLATPAVFEHLRQQGEVEIVGVPSIDWLGVPLLVGDQAVGVVAVQTYSEGLRYGDNERDILSFVANQLALAVEQKRAEEARQSRAHYLAELNAITQMALYQTTNLSETLETIIERLGRLFNVNGASLLIYHAEHHHFVIQATWGEQAEQFHTLPPMLASGWFTDNALWLGKLVQVKTRDDLPTSPATNGMWVDIIQRIINRYVLVLLPLMADNTRQGLLVFSVAQPRYLSAEALERAQQAANQLALVIAKSQALATAQQRAHEAGILHQALQIITAAANPFEAGQRILEQLALVVPYHSASVQLRDGADMRLIGWRGQALANPLGSHLPLGRAELNRAVLDTKTSLNIPDVRDDARFAVFSDVDLNTRAWLGVPLLVNDIAIGLLTLDHIQPGFFTAEHARQALTFANQVALAIDKARLIGTLQQQTEELAALYQASGQLLELGDTLQTAAEALARMIYQNFDVSHCAVFWLEPTSQSLVYMAQAGPRAITYPHQWPITRPAVLVQVAHEGRAHLELDVRAAPHPLIFDPAMRARLVLPLKAQASVVGVLNLEHLTSQAFDEARVRMLTNLAEQAGLALSNVLLIEQLQQARRAAQEASALKSALLANTSHELRTPLTGILGSLNLVLSGLCASPEEETMFVRLAYQSAERLMALINDLLDLSKIEAGRMEFDLQPVSLTLVTREVQAAFAPQARARSLVLDIILPQSRDVWAWADPVKTHQILTNLVGNAIKFTEQGRVMLVLDALPEVNQARIIVRDTGIGVAPDIQARLFQPFVQADGSATRKYGGTGLGLSISRQLAEHMGGALALHSAGLGQGTTLTLTLPLYEGIPG